MQKYAYVVLNCLPVFINGMAKSIAFCLWAVMDMSIQDKSAF